MALCWALPLAFVAAAPRSHLIHVATTGNDHNNGSSAAPLRTFGAATRLARNYPKSSTNVTIQFETGTYAVNETQALDSADSGRVYTAAPGAKVTLTADAPVTGWRPVQQPDAAAIADYGKAYATVCAATARAASPAPAFLDALDDVIAKLGGERQRCNS